MKSLILVFLFFFICRFGYSQTQNMLFENEWGEENGNAISYADELENGDFILIGGITPVLIGNTRGPVQLYACRIDSTGNIIWEKDWGNYYEPDGFSKAQKLPDGTYFIAGKGCSGNGDIADYTASRIDANGNIIFHHYFNFYYEDVPTAMTITSDSCFILWGRVRNSIDYFPAMLKVDWNGNEIWRRTQYNLLGYGQANISECNDGGFIGIGKQSANGNSYYAKYNSLGIMQWIKYPFGTGDTIANGSLCLRINADNTFDIVYAAYYTSGSIGNPTHYSTSVRRYNSQGEQLSVRDYEENFLSIRLCPKDSSFGCFQLNTNYYELDSNGIFQYKIGLHGADTTYKWISDYIHLNNGGYLGVGEHIKPSYGHYSRFYIVRFSPDGRYQPEKFIQSINAFPNPSHDGNITLSFDVLTDETVKIRVLASDGRLVYTDEIFCPANSHTELPVHLNLGTTSAGLYILETKTSGEYRRQKILITTGY